MDEQDEASSEQETPQNPPSPASPYEQDFVGNQQTGSQQVPSTDRQGSPYGQHIPSPQDYRQMPPQGSPYQQSGAYQQQPYQQPPYQQGNPYQQQQQPPQGYSYWQQGPYPPQQPYPANRNKSKVWPWVLIACLIFALVGMGGCVGCIACTSLLSDDNDRDYYDDYYYEYDDTSPYDPEYGLEDEYYSSGDVYTFADIKSIVTTEKSEIIDGKCSTGLYIVGQDIEPGLYFLEGNQTEEGSFFIFEEDSNGSYLMDAGVVYYGNYFAELEAGDVIVFLTPSAAKMYPVSSATVEVADPIQSGLYRVGTDIPAGTYTVTFQTGAPLEASQESGVYVMDDLEWESDSILEEHFLIEGGSHTITVADGQYVELFLATMTGA